MKALSLLLSVRTNGKNIAMQPSGGPTLQDVARHAQVSTATVSRCLNLPGQVRAETRARVEAAVAKLGYTPHFGARALASNRTNTIGAIIPTMENAIFARGLQALEDTLFAKGVTLLVATSHYDVVRESEQIRALLGRGVDGLVLIGQARPPETYLLLEQRRVPFVLAWVSQGSTPYRCVGFDNREAARAMAKHVLRFGHRRIAMIAGVTAWNDRASARIDGVREGLAAAGLSLDPPYLIEAPYTLEAGAAAAGTLMALPSAPTAIICGNDVLAAGAVCGLRERGWRVPDDVSVVGFDDIDLAVAVTPALTTVHVPHRRMGQVAGDLLHRIVCGKDPGDGLAIETEVVERASLAAPRIS